VHLITNTASSTSTLQHLAAQLNASQEVACVAGYVTVDALFALDIEAVAESTRVRLLVGMAIQDGLVEGVKKTLAELDTALGMHTGGGIRLTAEPCHSKFWAGTGRSGPWDMVGSSNLSRQGLYERREANVLDITGTLYNALLAEFEDLWSTSKPVSEARVRLVSPNTIPQNGASVAVFPVQSDEDVATVKISLVAADGEVQGGDGLNWWRNPKTGGVRRHRPDEACIPIRKSNSDAITAVLGSLDEGKVIHASTSTGAKFDLVLQGTGAGGNAKQIASKGDLQIFGRWLLRDVLRLAPGTRVTANILRERVGTTAISVTRLGWDKDGLMHVYLAFERD
jgi:hypothetical protein